MDKHQPVKRFLPPLLILTGALILSCLAFSAYAAPTQDPSDVSPPTSSSGVLILVPGRLRENDQLHANIHNVTNTAFRYFHAHSYAPDDIYYLATDASLDADGDGLADVDAPATKANLQFAITEWARHRLRPGQFVTLYMVGYGSQSTFYLDNVHGEIVTPAEIDAWLDQLEDAIPGIQTNLVVDASRAGAYVNASTTPNARGRVIVSSTSFDGLAYASQRGAVFSDLLLETLGQGRNLWDAFAATAASVQPGHPDQTPWLDADGDGTPNEDDDRVIAVQRVLLPGGVPPTPTPTPVPTLTPDPYEPDDTCEQAHPISTDGTPQSRSLHHPADADWASLDLEAGTTYLIETIEDSPKNDLILELFDNCGNTGDGPFSASGLGRWSPLYLVIRPETKGTYYLKVTADLHAGDAPKTYMLSVKRLPYSSYLPWVKTEIILQ